MKDSYLKLIGGYKTFKKLAAEHKDFFDSLTFGQTADVFMISCCDARVMPSMILQSKPGEVFITRNIAGLVPPYDEHHTSYHATSAAIEYAVLNLKVKHIIILGHTKCGGIEALVQSAGTTGHGTDFIGKWMEIALPALKKMEWDCSSHDFAHKCAYCEMETLKISLANLKTFPIVQKALKDNTLNIHAMLFDIKNCTLSEYNLATDKFEEIGV